MLYLEFKAIGKRAILNNAINIATSPIDNNTTVNHDNVKEGVVYGVGASGLAIYDIYLQHENHKELLEILEQRWPIEIGKDTSILGWFDRIEKLYTDNEHNKAFTTYVSAFAGEKAEMIAKNYFEENGFEVEQFSSKTHEGSDLVITDDAGNEALVQVKSTNSAHYVIDKINENMENDSGVNIYFVNKEVYGKLEDSDMVEKYSEKGVTIINGEFSNEMLRQSGGDNIDSIHDAWDTADGMAVARKVPYVALLFFGYKTVKNAIMVSDGKQSETEFAVNVACDGAKAAVGATIATVGGKFGALIGTAILPGVGTIIGGGIGAVLAGIAGGAIFDKVKEHFKWGKVIKGLDLIGSKFSSFPSSMISSLSNQYYDLEALYKEKKVEYNLTRSYKRQLSVYSSCDVSMAAILPFVHCRKLDNKITAARKSLDYAQDEILELCNKAAIQKVGIIDDGANKEEKIEWKDKVDKIRKRYFGNFILELHQLEKNDFRDESEYQVYKECVNQLRGNPNHPYTFSSCSDDIFKGLSLKGYSDHYKDNVYLKPNYYTFSLCIMLLIQIFI